MGFIHQLKEALKTKTGTQLAAGAGVLMTFFTMMPSAFETVINILPAGYTRAIGAIFIGAFTFGIPTIAQMKDDNVNTPS